MLNNAPEDKLQSRFFVDQTRGKSDRAVAIEAIVLLDMHLIQLLLAFMVRDPAEVSDLLGEDHPLGSFSARIRAAYCLGLISVDERDDLWTLKNIWEFFIHQMEDISFSNEPIRGWCQILKLPHRLMYAEGNHSERRLFVFTTAMLVHLLSIRIQQAEQTRRTAPEEFSLISHLENEP
ncbi:MAG TPA: MltR family transcriptional regulator [Anaerolineales bacterium]|nr:MltR family transcriptional regulator [Anaerolineales bacterium]